MLIAWMVLSRKRGQFARTCSGKTKTFFFNFIKLFSSLCQFWGELEWFISRGVSARTQFAPLRIINLTQRKSSPARTDASFPQHFSI